MREELIQVFDLLCGVNVDGYQSVKSLAVAMDSVQNLVRQMDSGEIVVRRREEGKHGAESKRQDD